MDHANVPRNAEHQEPEAPPIQSLQFEKAEVAENKPVCASCGGPMAGEYYQLAGTNICTSCAARFEEFQRRPKNRWVLRGALYGSGAAIGCSILYAIIVYVTKFELALMAILVGYVVGNAVRKGSQGLGGRRCQVLAVALTYFSITTSYIPLLIQGATESEKKEQEERTKKGEPPRKSELPKDFNPVLALVAVIGIAAILPFLSLTSGFSGILGLLIIFFGLQRAWHLTARDERVLMGPYRFEEEQPATGNS